MEFADACATLSEFRRPLRRGSGVLQEGDRRQGGDGAALEGQPGQNHPLARQRRKSDAFAIPGRRYHGDGIMLSIAAGSEAEAEKLFGALAEGGQVQMPLGKTFFAPRFGMVADKFGVGWMVVVAN
jgi:hypothetical protein